MILVCALQVALALDWTSTTWSRATPRDGVLRLSAGEPLRLEAPVGVETVEGESVPVRAGETHWWIDPVPYTRYLHADAPVRLHTVDRRAWRSAWAAWEHDAALALAQGAEVPLPPDGTGALAARVRARGRAMPRDVALLGLWVDVAEHRGLSSDALDSRGSEQAWVLAPGESIELDGDGLFEVGVRSLAGTFTRLAVEVAGEPWSIAASGRYSVFRDVVRGSGAPPLVVRGDAEVPVEVRVRHARIRGWTSLPSDSRRPEGLAGVEWDALHGLAADFTPWLEDPDPAVATWARVRALESAAGRALERLADPASPGDPAVAHAVVARAADLPLDIPLAWLAELEAPVPRVLAAWLDGQRGSRPHGLALLDRALRGRPGDSGLANQRARHAAERTRWVALESDRDVESTWRFATDGLGLPRLRVGPGQEARLRYDAVDPILHRVVRLTAARGTRLHLDDQPIAGEGELRFGLAEGEHVVRVETGAVLLPTRGWEGGEPGVGWRAVPLPATFTLPGGGAELELRVQTEAPVTLVFDDGRVAHLEAGGSVTAGAFARSVRVEGRGAVGVSARLLRIPSDDGETLERQSALDRIRATTAEVDAGNPRARAERARALATLGHRRLAWADVSALESVDPDLYRRAWSAVAAQPVVTRLSGALDPRSSRAAGLETRARTLELLEAGRAADAFRLADTDDLHERALRSLRWRPVHRADESGGLVPVQREERDVDGLFAEVDRALVRAPWPRGETVEIHEGAVDRVTSARPPLTLDVWCRDVSLQRTPCALATIGADQAGRVVGDGELARLVVRNGEVEVGPVGEDQVVVLRATDRDGLLEPGVRRLALAVRGRLSVTLPPDRLARFEVIDGDIRPRHPVLHEDDGRFVVDPGGRLLLDGRGTVLLAVSEDREEEDELLERPARPELGSALRVDDLWPELERADHRLLPSLPTAVVETSLLVDRDIEDGVRWAGGQLEAGLYRASRRSWWFVEAWTRLPGGFGLSGEAGWRGGRTLLGVRSWATTTGRLDAGSLTGRVHLRTELGPRLAWLRLDAWPRIGWVSEGPGRSVDARAWTLYRKQHPFGVDVRLTLLSEPTRDLRLRTWVEGVSNASPDLDRVTTGVRGDLLLQRHQRFAVQGEIDAVFSDSFRSRPRLTPAARAIYDVDVWSGTRRWLVFAQVGATGLGDVSAQGGLSVSFTHGRGLRDAPPTRDLFRTLREVP